MLELKSSTMPHAFGCLTSSSDSGDRRLWSCGSSSSSSGSGRSGVNSPASSSSLSPSSPCSPTGPSGAPPSSQHHFSRSDVPSTFPTVGAYPRFTYPGLGGVLGLAANGHLDSFDHPDLNMAAANELFKMDQDRLRQRQAVYNNNILPPSTVGSNSNNNNSSERSSSSSPSPTTSPPQGAAQIASELYRLFLSPPPLLPETPSSSTPYPSAALNRSVPPPQPSRPVHIPGYVLPPSSAALMHQRGREILLEQQPASTRAVWDEFNLNGRESDLDELDLLLRGLDVRDGSRGAVMSLPDDIPGGLADFDADILTKSRLFEILRDRERQRSYRRRVVKGGKQKVCVFCRNNGEAESTYTSHQLKDQEGKITCPILYIYTCPICGANGPNAHTIKYCPLNPGDTPNIRSLKTSRTSAGKRRIP